MRLSGMPLECAVNNALRWQRPQYVWCVGIRMTLKLLHC